MINVIKVIKYRTNSTLALKVEWTVNYDVHVPNACMDILHLNLEWTFNYEVRGTNTIHR